MILYVSIWKNWKVFRIFKKQKLFLFLFFSDWFVATLSSECLLAFSKHHSTGLLIHMSRNLISTNLTLNWPRKKIAFLSKFGEKIANPSKNFFSSETLFRVRKSLFSIKIPSQHPNKKPKPSMYFYRSLLLYISC